MPLCGSMTDSRARDMSLQPQAKVQHPPHDIRNPPQGQGISRQLCLGVFDRGRGTSTEER